MVDKIDPQLAADRDATGNTARLTEREVRDIAKSAAAVAARVNAVLNEHPPSRIGADFLDGIKPEAAKEQGRAQPASRLGNDFLAGTPTEGPLDGSMQRITNAIPGHVFGHPSEFNALLDTGNLTQDQYNAFLNGGQTLIAEMRSNPALKAQVDKLHLRTIGDAAGVAAALDERRTFEKQSFSGLADILSDPDLPKRAAQITDAIRNVHEHLPTADTDPAMHRAQAPQPSNGRGR